MKKILVTILIVLATVFLVVFFIGRNISRRALPDYSKPFPIKHLKDSVRIYRDSFAMPHVYAKNAEDLYRVTGYLIAQDRLWQMDLLRHVTTGTLSEILGKDLLDVDILMRNLRIPEKSELLYRESSPEIKAIFEAYSNGINQYIEENRKKLPPEFAILGYKPEPWKPQHSFNLVGYMSWDLNGSWNSEIILYKLKKKLGGKKIQELVPSYDSTQTVIFSGDNNQSGADWGDAVISAAQKLEQLGAAVFHGSNNWAVNSQHSSSGKPVLANDMHLGLMAPGIWYQMHQVVEGQLNVTGVMLPGAPFIISGHNDAIAWGMTNVMNDDIDFYREEISPDSTRYKFEGAWKPLILKKEKIRIKGGDSILKTLKFTHRGPIISELKGISDEAVSMHWIGNEWSNEIRTVYLLNRAKNRDDFREAVKTFISVSQNIVYADTAGNIGLYCSAGVPRRKGPAWEVLPGTTAEFDWKGMVPFDSLPGYFNPAEGIAVSANNKTAPEDYPYYISCWYELPFRFNRIKNMLLATDKHSPETFKTIQTDFHSENVRNYLPRLLTVLNRSKLDEEEARSLKVLQNWDMTMDAGQIAPSIYETFFVHFLKNLLLDDMGEELYTQFIVDKILVRHAIHRTWTKEAHAFTDDIHTKETVEKFDDLVVKSYRDALRELSEEHGKNPEDWKWGNIHKTVINHPLGSVKILARLFHLNRGPYASGGSFHTVEPYAYKYSNPFEATHGASQRHIYVTGNWDESWNIIPTGISGIPSSPYYCDQTEMYMNKKYRHDWFSREAVVRNAKYRVMLEPEKNQ